MEIISNTKKLATTTTNIPRTIIKNTQIGASEEAISILSKPYAIRQMIKRVRNKKLGLKTLKADTIEEIEIPLELRTTHSGEKFYWDDSLDSNRIMIFTTKKNLQMLSEFSDWYADGTFDVSPTFFKQVYTIHVVVDYHAYPVLYALLPNKKQCTYKKFFRMVKSSDAKSPLSINIDYEKAVMNAGFRH